MRTDDILREAANTFEEKNKQYKANYKEVGNVLAQLFPGGIRLMDEEDFTRFQFLVMITGKLTRYTNNFEEGGHQDSLRDLAVYTAMLESYDFEKKGERCDLFSGISLQKPTPMPTDGKFIGSPRCFNSNPTMEEKFEHGCITCSCKEECLGTKE